MPVDLEQDIVKLRGQLREVESDHTRERAAADQLVAEMRESGADLTAPDNFAKVDEAYKRADALRDAAAELRTRQGRLLEIAGERAAERADSSERREARTIAERYLRSAEYQNAVRSNKFSMRNTHVDVDPVEVATREETIDGLRMRTTVDNSAGSGGGVIWSDRHEDLIVMIPQRQVRLLDVITIGSTDSDTVEWTAETTHTDNAAETPYGTSAPESAYGWTKQSTGVKRVPHFVPATKGAVADGGQLQTLLQNNLQGGLRRRVESQVYNGDGTGENLKGILQFSGLGSISRGTDTRFDAVHKAITNVRLNYFDEPTVIGIHPTDFENVILEKDANGNYVHGRAASEGTVQTIWGLVPVVSPVFASGTPLVGDYSQATLWVRAGLSIAMSDSHQDFFIKGLIAILAELRCAHAVTQAKAFCKVTSF